MARSSAAPVTPISGSLTQRGARSGATCRACGSVRVTRISLTLTDGSPVQLTSCHRCEYRTWEDSGPGENGAPLPVANILDKARKTKVPNDRDRQIKLPRRSTRRP